MLKSKGDKMPLCGTPAFIFVIPDVEELCWSGRIGHLIKRNKREGRHFILIQYDKPDRRLVIHLKTRKFNKAFF